MARVIDYKASPTGAKFHASSAVVRGFMGPVGNGKSVTCIMELHRLAITQAPNCDGVRKTKFAIVRNTYDMLETTTLATFKQWLPEEICHTSLKPMRGDIDYKLDDGTRVEAHVIFLALDRPEDVKKLLSLEVTAIFINEAKELPYAVLKAARERIGRYPSQIDGYIDTPTYKAPRGPDGNYEPCTRKAVLMDTNPPEDTHWWYQLAEEGGLREGRKHHTESISSVFEFFRGPAPFIKDGDIYINNPLAENIKYLPGGYQYYRDMLAGNTFDHINVMIMGNYGTIKDGKPVYPQYNDRIHCPEKPLPLLEGLPIGLGWDFGLTPACIIGQLTYTGQLRIVEELFAEDMDVRAFARDVVKPWLAAHCRGMEIAFSIADPAGNNRGEGEGRASIGILNDVDLDKHSDIIVQRLDMGFYTEPAPTNDPTRRIDAVARYMTKLVDGGDPGYLLSKSCTFLRKGKLGAYQYKRLQVSGDRFKDKPDKNIYSHTADAEQYLALGFSEGYINDDFEEDFSYNNKSSYSKKSLMGYG